MGTIGNLNAKGNVKIQNNGSIGNYLGQSSKMLNNGFINNATLTGSAQTQNNGFINNATLTGSAQTQNNGFMNNVQAFNQTLTQNNGTMNNLKLVAGNGDNLSFNNNGVTNNLDANVFSTQNNGFINIQNNGLVNNASLFDNVPLRLSQGYDLITYNNSGTTQNLTAGTAGIGHVDINNGGNIWNLNASGNTHVYNS